MLFDRARFNLDIPAISRFDFLNTADQGPKLACMHYTVQELEDDVFYNSPSRADVYARLHAATEASRRSLASFFHASPSQTATSPSAPGTRSSPRIRKTPPFCFPCWKAHGVWATPSAM